MATAATFCSSPPSLSIIPSLKTHQQCQSLYHFPSPNISSLSHLSSTLVSDESVALAASAEAVALARAAEQAARKAVELAGHGIDVRRRRRRRRRKGFECLEEGENKTDDNDSGGSFEYIDSEFLSRREEAEICRCLKETEMLDAVMTRVAETRGLEKTSTRFWNDKGLQSVERLLCRRERAKDRLTRSYRGLVASIAIGYQDKGLNLQDLIQEGSIGLLKGAQKFDPERGHKLSTYVYWWIKQAVIKAIADKSRLIRLPGNMAAMVSKVARANEKLTEKLRRKPSSDEIAEELNLEVSKVKIIVDSSRPPISLDRGMGGEGGMTLQEILQGPDETTPEYMVARMSLKQEVESILQSLTDRESHVLRLYFGLNGKIPRSCEEIGRLLKLSRERVRQIVVIALTKLRRDSGNLSDMKAYIV